MNLDTTIKDRQLAKAFERGKADALDLRTRSVTMDGTGIIAEERKAPEFDPEKDYTNWPVGAPVREGEQVFKLLQPHSAANYPGSTPSNTPALWSICHTTDPAKAKLYVAPLGTSGLYMTDECCTENGRVYRSKVDNGAYSPSEYPDNWDDLTEEGDVE